MASMTFFERWAARSIDERDRAFYVLALPAAVTVVGLVPHVLQLLFFPVDVRGVLRLSVQVAAGAVMIGLICYTITRFLSRPKMWGPQRHKWPLASHLLLLWIPTAILVDAPLRIAELSMVGPGKPDISVAPYVLGVSIGRTFLFSGGIVFYERLMGAVLEAADQRQRAIRLETQTLKNLIQPHFMLNSLNAIRANIEEAPAVAEDLLLRLTSILRKVIEYSSREAVAVKEEIDLVEDYVALMNLRFESDVRMRVDGVRDVPLAIPPLIVFSLVENSFKHGFSESREGLIKVSLETAERIRLTVTDNGSPGGKMDSGGGTGGQYVQARLELAFGSDFAFTHGRLEDGRYEAVIDIPWKTL